MLTLFSTDFVKQLPKKGREQKNDTPSYDNMFDIFRHIV